MAVLTANPDGRDQESPLDGLLLENYTVLRQIGRGRYATVFECTDLVHHRQFALKVFKETKQKRINNEIDILRHLADGPNIISLFDVVHDAAGLKRGLVLELVHHTDFRALYPRFRDADIRYYVLELLKALQFCHSSGVMHRDVRPHNVVIDHQARKLRLVGWGSAAFWYPDEEYSVRVSIFKAPELLLDYQNYDYSLDMWALGSMIASMVFRKEPFFYGNSRSDQLVKISRVLGTDGLFEFVDKHGLELEREDAQVLEQVLPRPWDSFIVPENQGTANDEAIDLLDKLLRYDGQDRLTADEAINHPYCRERNP